MFYNERCKLEKEYYEWAKNLSDEFGIPIDTSKFSTMITFLQEKKLLVEKKGGDAYASG